jgi:hypothetical protein
VISSFRYSLGGSEMAKWFSTVHGALINLDLVVKIDSEWVTNKAGTEGWAIWAYHPDGTKTLLGGNTDPDLDIEHWLWEQVDR